MIASMFLVVTIVTVTAYLEPLIERAIEDAVNGRAIYPMKLSIDSFGFVPAYGVTVNRVVITPTRPDGQLEEITIDGIRINATLFDHFRLKENVIISAIDIQSVTLSLRDPSPVPPRDDKRYTEFLDRIGRIETGVYGFFRMIDDAVSDEIELFIQGESIDRFQLGILAIDGGWATLDAEYEDYHLEVDLIAPDHRLRASLRRGDAEIDTTMTRDSVQFVFYLTSVEVAIVPDVIGRYIESLDAVFGSIRAKTTGGQPLLPRIVDEFYTIVDAFRNGTPIDERSIRFTGELTVSNLAMKIDGVPLPRELAVTDGTLYFAEDEDSTTARLDLITENSSTLSIVDLSTPRSDLRRVEFSDASLTVPLDTPLPSRFLPGPFTARLGSFLSFSDNTDSILLPRIRITANGRRPADTQSEKEPPRVDRFPQIIFQSRIDIPEKLDLSVDGEIDIEASRINKSSVDLVWHGPDLEGEARWSLTGSGSLSGSFQSLGDLSRERIPSGLQGKFSIEGTRGDEEIEIRGALGDGILEIPVATALWRGERYRVDSAPVPRIKTSSEGLVLTPTSVSIGDGKIIFQGRSRADSIRALLQIESVPISHFLEGESAFAKTTGSISGSLLYVKPDTGPPHIEAAIAGEQFRLLDESGSFRLAVTHDEKGFEIVSGEAAFGPLIEGSIAGKVPIRLGESGIEYSNLTESNLNATVRSGEFERFFPKDDTDVVPEGELTITARLEEQTGDLRSNISYRVRPDSESVSIGTDHLSSTIRLVEGDGDQLLATAGLKADDLSVATISSTLTIPGLSDARPTLDPKRIDFITRGVSDLPLEYLYPFIPVVVAMTGTLRTSVEGSGTLGTPSFEGDISIVDGEIRLRGPIAPISALNGTLYFEGSEYHSDNLSGETALAPFTIDITGAFPTETEASSTSIQLRGENLLLTTSPTLRVRGDTVVSVTGSHTDGYLLQGAVDITEGIYSKDIPLIDFDTTPQIDPQAFQLFSIDTPLGRKTEVDLSIRSNEALRVESNIFDGTISSNLTIQGTLAIPRPQGRVFTGPSKLLLPLTTIDIRRGVLRFPVGRPFSPEINAQGVARIRNYRVEATVTGTPTDIELNLASTPPLSQSEALVLLATGFTPQELSQSGNRTAISIGSRLGTQFVQSLIGNSGSVLGSDIADRVSVILGEGVSETGTETIEVEFRLSDEDSWFLVFRRDRYERYNMDLSWRFWLE